MTASERDRITELLAEVIVALHRAKTQAYGDAWKRRGEQVGVLANIARKYDRIVGVGHGRPATADESLFDTAIDFYVYLVKYETYLADRSEELAADLFSGAGSPPYSDGTAAFDLLVRTHLPADLQNKTGHSLEEVIDNIADAFAGVEEMFTTRTFTVKDRWRRSSIVRGEAARLVFLLSRLMPSEFDAVLRQYGAGIDA